MDDYDFQLIVKEDGFVLVRRSWFFFWKVIGEFDSIDAAMNEYLTIIFEGKIKF